MGAETTKERANFRAETRSRPELMAERGWTTPMWPQEYRGGRLSKAEFQVLLGPGHDRTQSTIPQADLAKESLGETVDGKVRDLAIRPRVIKHNLDARAFALTKQRAAEEARANMLGAATSIFKLRSAHLAQEQLEPQLLLRGSAGLGWVGGRFEAEALGKDGYGLNQRLYPLRVAATKFNATLSPNMFSAYPTSRNPNPNPNPN